jgi:CheY-like chemotaxis protein
VRAPSRALAGLTVLAVDADPDALAALGALLAGEGAEVIRASSAAQALAAVRRRPDVIVADLAMPDRDGLALMRDVRGLAAADGGDTPAVALSTSALPADRARAVAAGYQVQLRKPAEPLALVATVRSVADARVHQAV